MTEERALRTVRLDQFLKFSGQVQTGGHAKIVIQNGDVKVNGTVETRRRRKLVAGDRVGYEGRETRVPEDALRENDASN